MTLQPGDFADFTANIGGGVQWYVTDRGFADLGASASVGFANVGGQNQFYNSAMRKSSVAGVADGWALEGPGSPRASTGVLSLAPSFM